MPTKPSAVSLLRTILASPLNRIGCEYYCSASRGSPSDCHCGAEEANKALQQARTHYGKRTKK